VLPPDHAAILQRIYEETKAGRLQWQRDDEDYFTAEVGTNVQPILIRRMWIAATNQVGADPYFVEVKMSGWNTRYAIVGDSEGWQAVRRILEAAFPGSWGSDAEHALEIFERKFQPKGANDTSD
jgi:hypothetical protein